MRSPQLATTPGGGCVTLEAPDDVGLLVMPRDGLDGIDLGVMRDVQYAVSLNDGAPHGLLKRPSYFIGTYGGWQWECSVQHAARYPEHACLAQLALYLDTVLASDRVTELLRRSAGASR